MKQDEVFNQITKTVVEYLTEKYKDQNVIVKSTDVAIIYFSTITQSWKAMCCTSKIENEYYEVVYNNYTKEITLYSYERIERMIKSPDGGTRVIPASKRKPKDDRQLSLF